MNIKRMINDTEYTFELTPSEMTSAYYEQQYEFDKLDVETLLDSFDDDYWFDNYGWHRADITQEMIEDMASEMRRYIDKYDCDWDWSRDEAVGVILKRKET